MNSSPIYPKLAEITERIIERSRPTREKYLAKIRSAKQMGRLERPSRRRYARHVRRHHARLCRYGIVAVLP